MAISTLNSLPFVPSHNQTPLPFENPPPPNLPLLPFKDPSTLSLATHFNLLNLLPKVPLKTAINEKDEENESPFHHCCQKTHSLSVAFPSLAFSNTLFFACNVELIVEEDEHEEKLVGRFRREVLKVGVLQECKRRRFFECSQEKRKRKTREAARRYRKRRPPPKVLKKDKAETSKKKTQDSDDDNWEFVDTTLQIKCKDKGS